MQERPTESKAELSQYVLFLGMKNFLSVIGEDFPEEAEKGLCNAYVMMRIRARALGQEKQYLDRLELISHADADGRLIKMAQLFKKYKLLYAQSEAEIEEKLQGKSKEQMKEIREQHQQYIINQVVTHDGVINKDEVNLLEQAEDIYYFINSLLAAFNPNEFFKYRIKAEPLEEKKRLETDTDKESSNPTPAKDEKTVAGSTKYRPVNQSDLLDALVLLTLDEKLLRGMPIQKSLDFAFTFSEEELADFFANKKTIQENDMIRIGSTNHVMFITKKSDTEFILDDPNNEHGSQTFTTPQKTGLLVMPSAPTENTEFKDTKNAFVLIQSAPGQAPSALYFVDRTTKTPIISQITFPSGQSISTFIAALYPSVSDHHYQNIQLLSPEQSRLATSISGQTAHQKLAAEVRKRFLTIFKYHDKLLPICMQIYEMTNKPILPRPTSAELIDDILSKRNNPKSINYPVWDGSTALMLATLENNVDLVKTLLEKKAHPNISDLSRATPLFYAAERGSPEIVRLLADALMQMKKEDKINVERTDNGETPILIAAKLNHVEVLAELANYVPNEFAHKNSRKQSALHYTACYGGSRETIEELLKHMNPKELIARDTSGCTPGFYAAENGHAETFETILIARKKTGRLNFTVDFADDKSPLVIAAENNHPAVIRVIAKHDREQKGHHIEKQGNKAGNMASKNKNAEAMKALLECGANFEFISKDPALAIRVLLKIKNFGNYPKEDGLHPNVIKHINKNRNKLLDAYRKYVAALPNPIEQRKQINAILKQENILGILFNQKQSQPCLPLYKPVTDIQKILTQFKHVLEPTLESKHQISSRL
ncbi:MAG: ankyrin repeat domain-containing protein [Gammaproteobacteria bacterium]